MAKVNHTSFISAKNVKQPIAVAAISCERSDQSFSARDITVTEASQHLQRLSEAGLIQKDSYELYGVTLYGGLLLLLVPGFDFASRNKAYFLDHDTSILSMQFVDRIDMLSKSTFRARAHLGMFSSKFFHQLFREHRSQVKSKSDLSHIMTLGEDMPYIKMEERVKYDDLLRELISILKARPVDQVDGELNYIITRLLKETYPLRYFNLNRAVGVLECAKLEFYRRVAAPYEDVKIKESGDV